MTEEPRATWEKRYWSRHYSYRDFYTGATGLAPVSYVFGTNARTVNRWNWPMVGDALLTPPLVLPGPARLQCYAREVMVQCTEDCWIIITSLNPEYVFLLGMGKTTTELATLGVPPMLVEVPQFIPSGDYLRFFPTYGYAITFYQSTVAGVIRVWVEGNTEGGE